MHKHQPGFTLIELLVVVLIIGILAAMAMPQYFKAVERSRTAEAVTLLDSIANAQERKYIQINQYVTNFKGLDVSPKGATGSLYYTKGSATGGDGGNGFAVSLSGTAYKAGKVTAKRHADSGVLQYNYTLERYYINDGTSCTGMDSNGEALCADFCGVEDYTTPCCSDGTLVSDADSGCKIPTGA